MSIRLFDCHVAQSRADDLGPVWQSGNLASGPAVTELEERLGKYLGCSSVVALSDMTHALVLALQLAGVRAGDEVVTLAFNCMSSNAAIALARATPVWVDVDPSTMTVDIKDLASCITSRTKAVIIYHVAGYLTDLEGLRNFCDSHGLPLIEDANNALGANWQDRSVGTFGDYAVFSFYANRQVNGIDGAALVCPNSDLAERARRLRRFGIDSDNFRTSDGEIDPKLDVPEIGLPASLANVNAKLACLGFDDLDSRLEQSRKNFKCLSAAFEGDARLKFVNELPRARSAFWVALVRCSDRDRVMAKLKASGIQCSRLHQRNDRYTGFYARSRELPGTTTAEQQLLALPTGWWLSPVDIQRIIGSLRASLD